MKKKNYKVEKSDKTENNNGKKNDDKKGKRSSNIKKLIF